MVYKFSPSSLNLFKECPNCFRLAFNKIVKKSIIFNTDLVKMKIDVKNAQKIFKKALETLKGDMPESGEECDYCKWVDNCNCEVCT